MATGDYGHLYLHASDAHPLGSPMPGLTPEQWRLYEERLDHWHEKLKHLVDANRESQRITAEDLAIIVY